MTPPSVAEDRPPADVVAAFGGTEPAERLAGGRGMTWRAGSVVLRPAEALGETEWASAVLSGLGAPDGFTVPAPLRDDRGSWTRAGWHALSWVPGSADGSRLEEVLRAGEAFQQALSAVPRPDFLDRRDHAWARADRIAWGEEPPPADEFVGALLRSCRAVDQPGVLVHGDLLGNVLFAPGRPPAIIDWAPYWRPFGYGPAIAVVDAVCWHGHPVGRLSSAEEDWRQLLIRALVFRVATLQLLGRWDEGMLRIHAPAARTLLVQTGRS